MIQKKIKKANKLWLEYFTPKEVLTKTNRREIMEAYNTIAKEVNAFEKRGVLIILTPSTRWIPREPKVAAIKIKSRRNLSYVKFKK